MSKTKIMMGSDSTHIPTGYGTVKKHFAEYFRRKGYHVMDMGIQNTGNPHLVDGIEKLPNHRQGPYGADSYLEWLDERRPELAWYIGDPHWFAFFSQFNKKMASIDAKWYKSIAYFPIDNDVLPDAAVDAIMSQDYKVTFTDYGKRICNRRGIKDVDVVYHGVDTSVYKPLPKDQVDALKKANGLEDMFLVGQVNRNNFRKLTPLLMAAFAKFAENKNDVKLMLHCDPRDPHGFDLMEYVNQFGLHRKVMFNDRVKNPITGVEPAELNMTYNILDVHASATTGEGWGLTTTEAQAAGTPVIIGNHTTGPELVEKDGWLVPVVEGEDSYIFTQQGGHYYRVQFQGLVDALEDAYNHPEKVRQKGEAAAKRVRSKYAWSEVCKAWDPVLQRAME